MNKIFSPEELKNARQLPALYYCLHMAGGVAKYESETILIDTDAIKRMMPSFQGKPVYVGHRNVNIDKIQEEADGYVTRCFFNDLDGCVWAEMIIVSDAGHAAIADGWKVSNAYIPTEWGEGGSFHNVDYNRRIVDGIFTHLALVPDPRYEEADILTPDAFKKYCAEKKAALEELHNSKKEGNKMLKFFTMKREAATEVSEDMLVEIENGKHVSIKEMIATVLNAKKNEAEKKEEKLNADTEVTVGDEKMTMAELMNRYQKANEAEADDKKAEDEKENSDDSDADDKKAEDEKENEADAEAAKKVEEEKTNAKAKEIENAKKEADTFEQLQNAHKKFATAAPIETHVSKEARGKERY